jgi:hypothetical protein
MPISKSLSTALIDGTGAITPANVAVSTNTMTVGTAMYVVANGNVGIGTNAPVGYPNYTTLEVRNTGGGLLRLGNSATSAGYIYNDGNNMGMYNLTSTGLLDFGANGQLQMRITPGGNVGIGTGSPAYKLTLANGIFFAGAVNGEGGEIQIANISNTCGLFLDVESSNYIRYLNYSNTGMYFGNTSNYPQLYVASSNGNIGINTNSPTSQLEMYASVNSGYQSPITFSALNSNSVKRSYAQIQYSIEQSLAGIESGGIQFRVLRSNTMVTAAGFNGASGSQYWSFATENQERMRIDTNGNIGIGGGPGGNYKLDIQTTGSSGFPVRVYNTDANTASAVNADNFLILQNYYGVTQISNWQNLGMRIGSRSIQNSGNGNIYFTTGGDAVKVTLLNSTGNFYLNGGGIGFPATQVSSADANTLDDYEEGSWTPVFTSDTPPTGVTYSSRYGTYTKVGDLVYIRCTILLSSKGTGGSGTVYISGLPFSAAGLPNGYAYQNLGGYCYQSSGDTFSSIYGCVYDSSSQIVTSSAPGATVTLAWSAYGNASKISFSGCYKIN